MFNIFSKTNPDALLTNKRRDFLIKSALLSIAGASSLAADALDNLSIITEKSTDIYLSQEDFITLSLLRERFKRLKKFVGYANFNIISYNSALYYARNYSAVGKFTPEEVYLMERFFYEDPTRYGFYGERTVENISDSIKRSDLQKISRSGHFIFKGPSLDSYNRLQVDVDTKDIILTSGVRSVVKQMRLFVDKLYRNKGNLTKTTNAIAPPAYSYHSTGDYDLGKKGFGYDNFTPRFALTKEYSELKKLSYIEMRYTLLNNDGVRYEPWHIKAKV